MNLILFPHLIKKRWFPFFNVMVSKLLSWNDYSFITVAAIGEVMDIL